MLHYFNIALLTLLFIDALLFIVALLHVALFNVALLMLQYFNASLFAVALFDVALFTVAQSNAALCKYCPILCSTNLFLYYLILHYIKISLFDS